MSEGFERQLPRTQPTHVRSALKALGRAVPAIARMSRRIPDDTTPLWRALTKREGPDVCPPAKPALALTGRAVGRDLGGSREPNPQPPDRSASDVVPPMADVQPNQVIGPRPSSGTQGSSGTRPPVEVAQLSARPRTEAGGLPNKVNQLPPNEGPPTITIGSLRCCSLVQSSLG